MLGVWSLPGARGTRPGDVWPSDVRTVTERGSSEPPRGMTPEPDRKASTSPSIDATGSRNVSSKLQAFIDSAPDGSTIVFKAGGTYRLDTALVIAAGATSPSMATGPG